MQKLNNNHYISWINLINSQFSGNTMKAKIQLNYIWENVIENECKFGVIEAYWSNFHKPIYIAFKLPNTFPIYNKKS